MTVQQSVNHETQCCTDIEMQILLKRAGRRKLVRHGGTLCSRCYAEPPMAGQRYGLRCHAAREKDRRAKVSAELKRLRAAQQEGAR